MRKRVFFCGVWADEYPESFRHKKKVAKSRTVLCVRVFVTEECASYWWREYIDHYLHGNPSYPPSNKGLIAGLIKGNQWFSLKPLIRPAIS